jgi:hypothetical protein
MVRHENQALGPQPVGRQVAAAGVAVAAPLLVVARLAVDAAGWQPLRLGAQAVATVVKVTWDRCYDFFKYHRQKIGEKIGKNRRKIVIITSTPAKAEGSFFKLA